MDKKARYVGMIDKNGNILVPASIYGDIREVDKGLVCASYVKGSSSYDVLLNTKGKQITSERFGSINKFKDGFAVVTKSGTDLGIYGHIDKSGKIITSFRNGYEGANDFNDGMAVVRKGDKWGYVNTKGEEVIPPDYSFASPFYDGKATVHVRDGNSIKKYRIDKNGKVLNVIK